MGLFLVVQVLWLFVPAYVANMAPVFAMNLFPRWNAPLDGGRTARDGRRLLGASKTWRGVVAGVVVAGGLAVLQARLGLGGLDVTDFAYAAAGIAGPLVLGGCLGLGAVAGDAVKSYFKRRTGREGGAPWVPFDQLDFVVGALILASLGAAALQATGAAADNWWWEEFGGARWPALVLVVVLTPGLHLLVNWIGFKLRLKKVPW